MISKLGVLLEVDQDEENLANFVDTKTHLNWEIDKKRCFGRKELGLIGYNMEIGILPFLISQ